MIKEDKLQHNLVILVLVIENDEAKTEKKWT